MHGTYISFLYLPVIIFIQVCMNLRYFVLFYLSINIHSYIFRLQHTLGNVGTVKDLLLGNAIISSHHVCTMSKPTDCHWHGENHFSKQRGVFLYTIVVFLRHVKTAV